jgi:sporulation protein YlmC with PRC-barrel domain
MSEQFRIGTEVSCSDEACGTLNRVVVDPVAKALTHLVVEPQHPRGIGRLVPVDLVETSEQGIRLRCTQAEFEQLPDAEETQFLPAAGGLWGYHDADLLAWPYFGLGANGLGGYGADVTPIPFTHDVVPSGDVEIRRGEPVYATDGPIGRVQGLVIEPSDHAVTHVLLDEGHLWGKHRVAIPVAAVSGVEDGVRLTLTKAEVKDLPPVALDQD